MCGIVGKVSATEPIPLSLIERMCDLIVHRGPDSAGAHVEEGVGLGIRRLAIIDVVGGSQPIANEDESVVVVQNGEIYNYVELREQLEEKGHRFRTRSDTEVIVHLYEEYGIQLVEHLRGMFALAVWDQPRRRLLLARDRLGKKPLFYAQANGDLWFASEPRCILADEAMDRSVNASALDAYLHLQYVPQTTSAFAALRKLGPAQTLVWENGRTSIQDYWHLRYAEKDDGDEREMHERIRSALLESTRIRMRSDVPLGAFLSGGIDSSAVVSAMARSTSERIRTFSIGFDVGAFDETAHARAVARQYDTEHHEFRVEPRTVELLPTLAWHFGEPFADHSALPTYILSELTRRHVKVALSGDGGDESFAGYGRYAAFESLRRLGLARLPRAWWQGVEKAARARRGTAALRIGRLAQLLGSEPHEQHALRAQVFGSAELDRLYTPDFLAQVLPRRATDDIAEAWMASDAKQSVDRLLAVDVATYLPGALLVKMDIASMANSLEVRSPLLDHRFMEMSARLPADAKLRRGEGKRIFRDALRPWLPETVLDRPKQGFSVPLDSWFRGELSGLIREVLLDTAARNRGIFRPEVVDRMIDDHIGGRANNGMRLWTLLQLELWFRVCVEAHGPETLSLSVA